MKTILQDFSPSRIAQAFDTNMIAFGRLLTTLPQAVLYDEPTLCWFETGVPQVVFNGVLQTYLELEALPAAIDRVLTHFQQRNLPFQWQIGPSSQPTNFGKLLQARGIIQTEDEEPGMAADLHTLNEELPAVSNLTIHPVTTHDLLQQWVRTWGAGVTPEEVIQDWFTVYAGLPFGPERSLRLYLGTIDGKPVSTACLFLEAGVAAIHHIVTLHEFRRQGIGTAMTLMAAREARVAGYRVGVLTASPFGINIYRRLGFQECCQISKYEWYPI